MTSVQLKGVIDQLIAWAESQPGEDVRRYAPAPWGFHDYPTFAEAAEGYAFDAMDRVRLPWALSLLGDAPLACDGEAYAEWYARRPAIDGETREAILSERIEVHDLKPCGGRRVIPWDDVTEDMLVLASERYRVLDRHDYGSRTQIIRDNFRRCPAGDRNSFAQKYAADLPLGWRDSVLLYLCPGEPIVIVHWTPERETIDTTGAWLESENANPKNQRRNSYDDEDTIARWEARPTFESLGDNDFVAIPPARAVNARTLESLAARAPERASSVTPTGIAPLDALLATRGLPSGARMFVQAATANAKTTLALEAACSLAERGHCVAWIATRDEPQESIYARLLQRAGHERAEAVTLASDPVARERACPRGLVVIDGTETDLEDVIGATPGPDVIAIDSLQKVRTCKGAGTTGVTAMTATLDVIEASRVTVIATSQIVRGASRRARIEASHGGSGIEYGATLIIDLALDGEELTGTILKSRYGGEGESFTLRLDRASQRLTAPEIAPVVSATEARLRAAICTALTEHGALTQRAILGRVTGAQNAIVAALKAAVERGEITLDGKKYAIAKAA